MATMHVDAQMFELPPGYTFTPGGMLIHKDSLARLDELIEKGKSRDPSMFGLVIEPEFFSYGIMELVDETLSAAHTFIMKEKWLDAWRVLDCLQRFNEICDAWHVDDDDDRIIATERAYGALLITTIRGLDHSSPSLFNEATIPDLELSLSDMAEWGAQDPEAFDVCYYKVLKGYGRKLFGARTNEERKQARVARNKAYKAFVHGLSEEEREKRGDKLDTDEEMEEDKGEEEEEEKEEQKEQKEDDDDDDDDEDEDEEMDDEESDEEDDEDDEDDDDDEEEAETLPYWLGKAKVKNIEFDDPSFRITPIWKEYKTILADSTHIPLEGPPIWDLTKWTDEDKQPFTSKGMESRYKDFLERKI